jgi:nuclear protein localization family protein 4
LEVSVENPKVCTVNETFTAIQEGKASETVENDFFLCVVPIVQHTSEVFVADFPRLNREIDTRTPSHDALKRELSKSGTAGWTFEDRLADFNLLLYLSQFLDVDSDFPKICTSIVDRSVPLEDGYKLIIKSLAGLEGSY